MGGINLYDNNISNNEDKMILDQDKKDLEKYYHTGKIIVLTIATLNVAYTIIGNFMGNWNILEIIVQIVLSMVLYSGVRWGWGLFVVICFIRTLLIPFMFLNYVSQGIVLDVGAIIWIVLGFIHAAVSFWLLAYNKRVAEFLNYQRTL